ncbi:hypothetical protein [Galenea microaerophila]
MLEAAYVLPLIVIAIIAIIDAANYSIKALEVTQVLQDSTQEVMYQAVQQSENASEVLPLVQCAGGKVDLKTNEVKQFVTDALKQVLGESNVDTDAVAVDPWSASPINSYIIAVDVKPFLMMLPEFSGAKISSKNIISIDYSCE